MPLQNRVQPTGEILATSMRGRFMGNRGILHDGEQTLGTARWRHKAWVCCVLSFKNRQRPVMQPNSYTELFFLDEAVAFAAGHRPCAECRRADYNRFRDALGLKPPIPEFDTVLHAARVIPRAMSQRRYSTDIKELCEGVFILDDAGQALVLHDDALLPYTAAGYAPPVPRRKTGTVTVVTPRPLVAAFQAGYRPDIAAGQP